MKDIFKICVFFCAGIFFLAPASFAEKINPIKLPKAFVPEKKFKFEKVVEGVQILHDFKVINKGDATLNINKVKTG